MKEVYKSTAVYESDGRIASSRNPGQLANASYMSTLESDVVEWELSISKTERVREATQLLYPDDTIPPLGVSFNRQIITIENEG